MLSKDELARTARQRLLPGFGDAAQERLNAAHVLVVGAGGLGCPALQQLAAAGIGRITIIDSDTVDISNLHRQVLFGVGDVGKPKAEVAATRARELAPELTITALKERLGSSNVLDLCSEADLVLDGSDTFDTKYLVADACELTSTPLVWGTVLRYGGQAALWHSGNACADGRGVGLRDLFPAPPSGEALECSTAGVLGATTSVIAGLMATAAVAILGALPDHRDMVGRVTSYDALPGSFRTLRVGADPDRPLVTALPGRHTPPPELVTGRAALLDISEEPNFPYAAVTLPWHTVTDDDSVRRALSACASELVYVACASGGRSAGFVLRYADLAADMGIELRNLPGGLAAQDF
ncbi:ThiF family adenylyltransferase [Corynebacterium aurimucosum]|uniref:ThiF family adenylyltransferase n=1 Tax=Corynebacterium aurimucosum TaxID=169292 RepID=UPI00191E7F31|nr:ThiF family adenylyltransferase [Corynebacterium aurimucosum]QQU94639.1 ThiF family adenylyltransferase [Corynebacterium aurimucosum]UTA72452.1 ThiF family adenylyltransferase [Corynebacterium aurimucosum]WJY70782.1 putative adenylyltransferase/sulfurtransferase MoeZ [Corynebacterium aurimucosum]